MGEDELKVIKVHSWFDYRNEDGSLTYDWPYTNKCPECHQETMVGEKCTNCGNSMHQLKCPRCGRWMHHGYLDGREQCSLYCDVEDKRIQEQQEWSAYVDDFRDASTYPEELRSIAAAVLDGFPNVTNEYTKEQFIEYLRKISAAGK